MESWCTAKSVLEQFGIDGYWRFRDDILVLGSDRVKSVKFCQGMRARSRCFELECEGFYSNGVHFLEIGMHIASIRFEVSPKFKDTALQIPLSFESGHSVHVHAGWPLAQMRRLGSLSSSKRLAMIAKQTYLQRFWRYHAHPSVLEDLEQCDPKTLHIQPKRNAPARVAWLSLGYHPVWYRPLTKAVANFQRSDWKHLEKWFFFKG
jgi:hypothetical protein